MTNRAFLAQARSMIHEHGWLVQGVTNTECACCPGGKPAHHAEDLDPYLYTAGLTEAGLPELVLRMPGRDSREWLRAGQRLLNACASHSLHEELVVGHSYPIGIVRGRSATVGTPTIARDGGVWLGTAYALYGRGAVRALEILPEW